MGAPSSLLESSEILRGGFGIELFDFLAIVIESYQDLDKCKGCYHE